MKGRIEARIHQSIQNSRRRCTYPACCRIESDRSRFRSGRFRSGRSRADFASHEADEKKGRAAHQGGDRTHPRGIGPARYPIAGAERATFEKEQDGRSRRKRVGDGFLCRDPFARDTFNPFRPGVDNP